MKTSDAGISRIKRFERFEPLAYQDAGGVWTIGYGHTGDVRQGMRITQHQADVILAADLEIIEDHLNSVIPDSCNQDQFDALVSLAFNVGITSVIHSHLVAKFKTGDVAGAGAEFTNGWDTANGHFIQGLSDRRHAEQALFLGTV